MTVIFGSFSNKEARGENLHPLKKLALGAASFPVVLTMQSIYQNLCHITGGSNCINMSEYFKLTWKNFTELPNTSWEKHIATSLAPIGKQFIFGQFLQSYVLDDQLGSFLDQLGSLLDRVAPSLKYRLSRLDYSKFSRSSEGKIARAFASSVAYTTWRCAHEGSWNSAQAVNHFILGFTANLLTLWTKSNLPGMGLYLAHAHLIQ